MADERNFRMLYYGQLGLQNVDQMKALEHLLRDECLDKEKLSTFSIKYTLPGLYRPLVWKVLLDILPIYQKSHSFIMKQRSEQAYDLERVLAKMKMLPKDSLADDDYEKIVLMYLIESGLISIPLRRVCKKDEQKLRIFRAISKVCCSITDNDVDAFWISKRFFEVQDKFVDQYGKLPRFVNYYLQVEDKTLFEHLCEIQMLKVLPYNIWFQSCFAEVFPDSSLGRIWDKLVAGSCNILVFLCVALLLCCRLSLLESTSAEAAVKVLSKLPRGLCHTIIDKTGELWEQHRSTLSIELGGTHT